MRSGVLCLRVALWWGIIADTFETVRMAVPRLFLISTGLELSPDVGFRFGLLYGVPVMLGWTLLLLWANRRPMERKGVVLCLIPVICAYMAVEAAGITMGIAALSKMIPTFFLQAVLVGLCVVGYVSASRRESSGRESGACT